MEIELSGISISFGAWFMNGFSLAVPSGSFTSIVGPSGCGKTTILRLVAGLESPKSGKVLFDKSDVTLVEPGERNVGIVFQSDALFSHMNVFDNVAFGPRQKKMPDVQERVARALALVHLNGFEKRDVTKLSGGEKKRVAIARAIAFEPNALLLDEPLNGLDARLKEKTKLLLRELREKTRITIIMVTHDIDEAFSLSDNIAVMSTGKLEQFGSPVEIFTKPKTGFVKDFVSDYILVKARGKKIGGKYFAEGKFCVPVKNIMGTAFISLKKNNCKFVE